MTDTPLPVRQRVTPDNPAVITSLSGALSPDLRKVRVNVELSQENTRPDLELILKDSKGLEICRSTIIENFGAGIEFTMHIRQSQIELPITLFCGLSYEEDQIQDEKNVLVEQIS